jgi:signal transduction histidine kinase
MMSDAQLRALVNFLQSHSEREKSTLARELHDAMGGVLTPAKMDVAWLVANLGEDPVYGERVKRLDALIDEGIDLKRRIIEKLHPSLLDHLGLAVALKWHVEDACRIAGIECRLRVSDRLERLPADTEIALFRVAQESVANTVQHARAHWMEVMLDRTPAGVELAVSDDGVGIEDLQAARGQSRGLAAIQQRMRSIGGSLGVLRREGGGTRIAAFLPLA